MKTISLQEIRSIQQKGIDQAKKDIEAGLVQYKFYDKETTESYIHKRAYNDYISYLEESGLIEIP